MKTDQIKVIIISILLLLTMMAQAENTVQYETVFNTPGFTGQSTTTIEEKLIELLRAAVPDSEVLVSLYTVSRESIIKELVNASRRGVDVKVILDGRNKKFLKITEHVVHYLKQNLVCKSVANDCLTICSGPFGLGYSCRGVAINHNKFMLFSKLQNGTESVVASTSSNMNPGQLKMYNDLLIIKNDKSFFNGFRDYWKKLQQDETAVLENSIIVESNNSNVKAHFFPRIFASDPVLNLLNKVSCQLPNSSIRVAQAIFTRADVAEKMRDLAAQGCKLEVITRSDYEHDSPSEYIKEVLKDHIKILPFRGKSSEQQIENSLHSKVILINASIDNSPEKIPIVLAGSHNLNTPSLYFNDEALVEVRNQKVFDSYSQYLTQILQDFKLANINFL